MNNPIDKPTYVQDKSTGSTFRFPSMEETIRNSPDGQLDMMVYANGILEFSTPWELEIARDEIARREKEQSNG